MKNHELANLFPMMTESERAALVEDMRQNGYDQTAPIVLYEGKILDGRNRWNATKTLGIDPFFVQYEGDDPQGFVIRHNLTRRHLNESQRAVVAGKLANIKHGGDRKNQETNSSLGITQTEAAEMLSVSTTTIKVVKSVEKNAPELITEIEKGNLNVNQAQKVSKLPEAQREDVMTRVAKGESVSKAVKDVKKETREAEKPKQVVVEKKAQKNVPKLFLGKAQSCPFVQDKTVDIIITSPPYNMGGERWPMGGGGRKAWESGIGYDSTSDTMPIADYAAWQVDVLREMFRVAKDGASFFYNHKNRTVDGELISPLQWLFDAGNPWTVRQEIVWDRVSTHNHSSSLFWPIDERIYWMTKGKPYLTRPIGLPSVWKEFGPTPNTWHPAPFTEKLPEMLLQAVGFSGCVVLDPFTGSGSTLKAAQRLGFDSIGIDISAEYLARVSEENEWTM